LELAMTSPKVSVIIPTYNGARLLGEAIQSVLDQTYPDFELIVVNDASPDNTSEIMPRFDDPRIRYIVHEKNQGVDRSRYTGLSASTGEIIAFLDQDDFFHPEKLEAHVAYLEQHPEVGFTYNARFELNHSAKTIRNIWRPPRTLTLADLVLWFPIAPSDWVMRREWAFRIGFNGEFSWTGGEITYLGRLYFAGCTFGFVDRVLNYRRHHSGRVIKDLAGGCASEIRCQVKILDDPRCPKEVADLRDVAHANIYMFWAFRAFIQNETELGREFLRKAVQHKPSILTGMPCELVDNFVINSSEDENLDYSRTLKNIFAQLPVGMEHIANQFEWAEARGYLLKGARAVIWDRPEDGRRYFQDAARLGARVDSAYLHQLTRHLLDYETEFGEIPAKNVLKALCNQLEVLGEQKGARSLRGIYQINQAFQRFHKAQYASVPGLVFRASLSDPQNLVNRGVWAVFFRSLVRMLSRSN
jgi:glycosyltransferase involved in cell wall biosynthesis